MRENNVQRGSYRTIDDRYAVNVVGVDITAKHFKYSGHMLSRDDIALIQTAWDENGNNINNPRWNITPRL